MAGFSAEVAVIFPAAVIGSVQPAKRNARTQRARKTGATRGPLLSTRRASIRGLSPTKNSRNLDSL
jgi:hypothetical protein